MSQLLTKITAIVFSTCLFLILLLTSIEIIVYNLNYYEMHYEKRNIMKSTKMNKDDLMFVTNELIEYLKNQRDDLVIYAKVDGRIQEVFGKREKAHMVDVKNLFIKGTLIRNYSLFILFGLLFVTIWRGRKELIQLLRTIKYVFFGFLGIGLMVGILLLIDFNKYFTIFHLLFFDNDLWILDPSKEILVNMVPENFFFTTALIILGLWTVFTIITILLGEYIAGRFNKHVTRI